MINKVEQFLKKHNLLFSIKEKEEILHLYMEEMLLGLSKEKSSLKMIPTYLDSHIDISWDEKALVIDAGGTNLRVASIQIKKDGNHQITDFKSTQMPGIDRELSLIEFFDTIAHFIGDLTHKSNKIGFCFSYPTEILPSLDGRLINWTKEIKAPEVVGTLIGDELKKALIRNNYSSPDKIIILNDTVATLLAGKSTTPNRSFSDYIGYILGTGQNSCYTEKTEKIKNIDKDSYTKDFSIINLESGNFDKFPTAIFDKELDDNSNTPTFSKQEKVSSGRYYGETVLYALKQGVKEGVFTGDFAKKINQLNVLETKDANNFLINPFGVEDSSLAKLLREDIQYDEEQLNAVYHILDTLLERAAIITAINISSTILKSEQGKSPLHPICITIDGTAFYLYHQFNHRVYSLLHNELLTKERKRYFEFNYVENAPLIGAAIAALTV